MDLDLSVDGEIMSKMTNFLKNIVYDFPETIQRRVATPEVEHLFTVREDAYRKLLDEE